MAEVKVIVKQMKDAGMGDAEILANLQELGIENAEEQMAAALRELPHAKKTSKSDEEPIQITRIEGEREQTVDIRKIIEGGQQSEGEEELMRKIAATNISNADEVEDKLDQIIALLKSLQEVNKKILETNRDLLVKINKKTSESDKPQLGKIF